MSYPSSLKYFMWEWQVYFRISCQTGAENLFNSLDPDLQPRIFLIGFNKNPSSNFPPICVDPENLEYTVEEFFNIEDLANEIGSQDEDKHILYSQIDIQQEMDIRFEESTFKDALEKILNNSVNNKGTVCFAASSVRVRDYQVFIVLELNKDVYYSHQHLKKEKTDERVKLFRSFLETTMKEFLSERERTLYLPAPGKDLSNNSRRSDEILRSGARLFMYSVSAKGANFYGLHGLFDACNELSLHRYENAENYGHLIVAKRNHPDIEMTVEVDTPFEIKEFRKTRKMLELTNEEVGVICDSYQILGLGKLKPTYDSSSESVFNVFFKGIHCWDIFHMSVNILQMRYGLPQFSKETINKEKFFINGKRIFSGVTTSHLENLYRLAMASSRQKKGAMLVISDKAKEEARRFGKRCISIKPIKLDEKTLLNLTSIDGGVLIDPEGFAHAKGVILDGIMGKVGDAGRGSRYNSAITYCEHTAATQSTMIVVVSSDGMVDILPNMQPQIKHSEIKMLIRFLEKLTSESDFNRVSFYETMQLLFNRRFYLTSEECSKINKLKRSLEKLDETFNDSLRRLFEDFHPNSDMNNSYYLKE